MIHIIDDNPLLCTSLAEIIEAFDYPCECFFCPTSYCEYAHSNEYNKPTIIITDVRMPHISGYELIDKISAIYDDIKFIVMSGYYNDQKHHSECPHTFMEKPFHPEQLDKHIQALINNSK